MRRSVLTLQYPNVRVALSTEGVQGVYAEERWDGAAPTNVHDLIAVGVPRTAYRVLVVKTDTLETALRVPNTMNIEELDEEEIHDISSPILKGDFVSFIEGIAFEPHPLIILNTRHLLLCCEAAADETPT